MTPETLAGLAARTRKYEPGFELPREDILLSLQGVDPAKMAFVLYAFGSSDRRHDFFAGLFMEVMQRPETQLWIQQRRQQRGYYRSVEALCLLVVLEWGEGRNKFTHEKRAQLMGVSRGTWNRKYKTIYESIVEIPAYWLDEILTTARNRLK